MVKEMIVDDDRIFNIGTDHNILFLKFKMSNSIPRCNSTQAKRVYWDIKPNHHYISFQNYNEKVFQDFDIDETLDANLVWLDWKNRLLQAANESIGVKTYKGNSKPWYDLEIDQAIQQRRQSNQRHRQYLKSGEVNKEVSDSLWEKYRSKQKHVKKLIREKPMKKRVDKCLEIPQKGGKACKDFWTILRGPVQKAGLPTFRNCLEGETSSAKRKNPRVVSRPA